MLTELGWLPPPPSDVRSRFKALRAEIASGSREGLAERIVGVSSTALDETQLGQAARLAGEVFAANRSVPGLSAARLGLVGDGTLDLAAPAIAGSGLRHGLALDVVVGEYGGAVREAMDPTSALKGAALDFLLIAPDARLLGLSGSAPTPDAAVSRVDQAFDQIVRIAEGFRSGVARAVLVQTAFLSRTSPCSAASTALEPTSAFAMVEALNRRIAEWAARRRRGAGRYRPAGRLGRHRALGRSGPLARLQAPLLAPHAAGLRRRRRPHARRRARQDQASAWCSTSTTPCGGA